MKTSTSLKECPKDNVVAHVLKEFRLTYADCLHRNMTNQEWQKAEKIRRLTWESPHRLSLADAFIAATASTLSATLIHKDPEFEQAASFISVEQLPYRSKRKK